MLGLGRKKPSDHERYLQDCDRFYRIQYDLEYGGGDTKLGSIALRIVRAFDPFDPRKLNNDDLSDPGQLAHLRKYLKNTRMNDPDTTTYSRCPFE